MSKRELKKSELKLSKNAQKAIALLDDLDTLLKKYGETLQKMEGEEKHLLGGMIIATYSPLQGMSGVRVAGHGVVLSGLLNEIKEHLKAEKSTKATEGLLNMLGGMDKLPAPPEFKKKIDKIKELN